MNIQDEKIYTIKYAIERSFVMACSVILIIMIICALYFNNSNLRAIRQNSLQQTHQMLSHLITPELVISNIIEIKRLLQLASTQDVTFAVIDNNGNIFMPDYIKVDLLKSIINPLIVVKLCPKLQAVYYNIHNSGYWVNCSPLKNEGLINNTQKFGALISLSKQKGVYYYSSFIWYFILVGVIILSFLFIWFRRILHRRLLHPLIILGNRIVNKANEPLASNAEIGDIGSVPYEVRTIKQAFEQVLANFQNEYQKRSDSEKRIVLLDLAAQVAHDIRSPLAVMEMNLQILSKNVPKDKTIMLREAIQSVRDIANNLLDRYRGKKSELGYEKEYILINDNCHSSRPILLFSLIESVISQKRHEWQHHSCELSFTYSPESKFKWINIAPHELKCILSNLLNNAYEALTENGKVHVTLETINSLFQWVRLI